MCAVCAAFLATSVVLAPFAAAAASRPNILLVVGDDIGWGDIRTNNPDGRIELPTIERLAQEGVSFADAHTFAAKCAPSRYSLLTGNYHWRGRFAWGNWKYKGGSQVLPGQQTLGGLLKSAGYTSAIVGKYHLGANFYRIGSAGFATGADPDTAVDFSRAMADGPSTMGFDYSFLALRGIQAGPYAFFENGLLYGRAADLFTWNRGDYGDTEIVETGIGLPSWVTRDVGPTLLSKALAFIDSHHSAQANAPEPRPFFLYMGVEAVHSPRKAPDFIGDRPVRGMGGLGERSDMLVELDAVVDSLMRRLQQLGLLENTLVIVTSDNGGNTSYPEMRAGHSASGSFRGDKGTIYEGGHRVPLIVKWGSSAFGSSPQPGGTVISAMVAVPDLYATLAELTGRPVTAEQGRDSVSFLPLLMGQASSTRDHMVHEADEPEDNAPDGGITGRHFAYRNGAWKLIFNGSGSTVGLYDLANDPYEKANLVARADQSQRVAALKAGFEQVRASTRTAPTSGTGVSDYSLQPTSISFGNQALNATSSPRSIALGAGSADLALASISLSGTHSGQFAQSNNCGSVLPAANTCTIQVRFGPTSVGAKVADLVVTPSGGATARRVALAGTGVGSSLVVAPASLSFGTVARGTVSTAKTVTVSNTGAIALPIKTIALTGTNHAQFLQTHACPAELAVGGTCKVSVKFKPTSIGAKSAGLRITPGGGASIATIALTGTGT